MRGVKPEPGARRYFFIPSPDGARWELAEATYRRGAWDVAYPAQAAKDRFEALPPPKADWVEMVPPGRAPRRPWPPKPDLLRLAEAHGDDGGPEAPEAAEPASGPADKEEAEEPPKPKAKATKAGRRKPAVPKKAIPNLSKELEGLMAEELRSQEVPEGKVQCPACGLILEPTRNKRVRTHDDPLKGARCGASGRKWEEFGKPRPPRPRRG